MTRTGKVLVGASGFYPVVIGGGGDICLFF